MQMYSLTKIGYFFYCCWTGLIMLLFLLSEITFGYGLGDLYFLIMVILFFLVFTALRIIIAKNKQHFFLNSIFITLMLATIVYFSLKLTVYRGPEYKWNGDLFKQSVKYSVTSMNYTHCNLHELYSYRDSR